jgi:hypothetical protein
VAGGKRTVLTLCFGSADNLKYHAGHVLGLAAALPVDVNRIVLDVTDSLREELDSHGVMAHYELTTELPLVNGQGRNCERLAGT